MDRVDERRQLAHAFLEEARQSLNQVLGAGAVHGDPTGQQEHLDAMIYWARAHRNYRVCHGAQNIESMPNVA